MSTNRSKSKGVGSSSSLSPVRAATNSSTGASDDARANTNFGYTPLDPSERQIRLLRITGVSEDDTIECSIHTACLDDDIPYAALSYVWGDANVNRDIYVNGCRRKVTRNLESALRHIRNYSANDYTWYTELEALAETYPNFSSKESSNRSSGNEDLVDRKVSNTSHSFCEKESAETTIHDNANIAIRCGNIFRGAVSCGIYYLWVDAICIDQDNLSERNQQVQLMGEIYTKAHYTFSWIDSSKGENADLALRTIRELVVDLNSQSLSDLSWMSQHPELCLSDDTEGWIRNKYWKAITKFTASEYFKRLWIFQELWLGNKRVMFLCNNECIPILVLLTYAEWAKKVENMLCDPSPPSELNSDFWRSLGGKILGVAELCRRIFFLHDRPQDQLWEFISIARNHCEDPRDKVYGLLGVFPIGITPDYNKPVGDVFTDWATDPFWDGSMKPFLALSGLGLYPKSNHRSLPSWVPDLELLWHQIKHVGYLIQRNVTRSLGEVPTHFWPRTSKTNVMTCFGFQETGVSKICTQAASLTAEEVTPADYFQQWLVIFIYIRKNWSYLSNGPDLDRSTRLRAMIHGLVRLRDDIKDYERSLQSHPITLSHIDAISTSQLFGKLFYNLLYSISELGKSEPYLTAHMSTLSPGMFQEEVEYPELFLPIPLSDVTFGQVIFHTANGLVGFGPSGMMATDKVYLIHGLNLPVLLREIDGKLFNVGACYIHGISDEDGQRILQERESDVREINIV